MSKSNAKFIAAEVEKNKAKLKNGYSHYIEEYELYGITEKGKILGTEKEQYVHIYYNGVESEKEKLQINKRFALMDKKLEELKGQIIKRAENLSSYKKYYKLKYDENGYFMGYQRDEKAIRKEIDNTGYFAIVSSREMKAEEALRIYRDRDAIEKIFRMEKSYLGNDVFRVHSSEKLESKVFVTFIALIIRNEIYKAMKGLYQKNKKEYTVPKVLKEIERLGLTKLSDEKYHMRYNLTKKQKQILKELKGVKQSTRSL